MAHPPRPLASPRAFTARLALLVLLAMATAACGQTRSESPDAGKDYWEGQWKGVDSVDGWVFELTVADGMRFEQLIRQGPTKTCKQVGRLTYLPSDAGRAQLDWYYEVNTCNEDYQGRNDADPILRAEPGVFELDLESYTIVYARLDG